MRPNSETTPPSVGEPPELRPAVITIDDVEKRFGSHQAVAGVALEIRDGEFFSLLGPSGSGKTTLLRMIAGFEQPDRGRILIGGRDVTALPPNHRPVNMMFQQYALFPHMSVTENVAFGLRMDRTPKRERERRVASALEMVRLTDLSRRRPAQLSGGQQQRVALARALVMEPQALLLDEPLGALDLKLRRHMQLELKRIQNDVGTAFVYVTHDQEEALTISDRIAVMSDGRVEQIASARGLYERPSTAFVADFIGQLNQFDVVADEPLGAVRAVALDGGQRITVPGDTPPGPVKVGIRPERMRLTRAPVDDETASSLRATVRDVVFLGTATVVHGETVLGPVACHLSAADGADVVAGDEVHLSWSADDAFVF
jgi:spermidine/putrescine transport system ATP-binding protein